MPPTGSTGGPTAAGWTPSRSAILCCSFRERSRPSMSSEKRFATNVPLQRLFFMNSDFMQQQAELLARRVAAAADTAARIRNAYSLVLGRAPTDAELNAGVEYLK